MSVVVLDQFDQQGVPYTGAVKVRVTDEAVSCCDCSGGDSSVIVFYNNGAPVDLWTCQGCQCLQKPVADLILPAGSLMALHPGAIVPEEVCSSCCYSRKLPDGEGGFAEAWEKSVLIGAEKLDLLQSVLINTKLKEELSIAKKQLEAQAKAIEEEPVEEVDPFDQYIKSLESQC